jgi:hypothetical protein
MGRQAVVFSRRAEDEDCCAKTTSAGGGILVEPVAVAGKSTFVLKFDDGTMDAVSVAIVTIN